jgi:uncharacterized protein with PIN domain
MKKFIADVHLGKLARYLRLLGFDTLYQNSFTNNELLSIAKEEERILLSRNSAFSKQPVISCIIQSEDAMAQLKQVVGHFSLKSLLCPFSRCMLCNGKLEMVTKETIAHRLKENTKQYFDKFWICQNCHHIYWMGAHYDRMLLLVEAISKE